MSSPSGKDRVAEGQPGRGVARVRRPPPWAWPCLVVAGLLFGGPIVLWLWGSLQPTAGFIGSAETPLGFRPRFANYRDAVSAMPFARYFGNSLVLAIGSIAGTLLSSSLTAYAFARLRWWGRDVLFGVLVGTMLLPWHVTMIPRFLLLKECGLYNSLWALILPTFLGHAFSIFLLRQFFLTIPEDLREAARMDGLSEWGIFWRIFVPLSRPALATVALFQGIQAWNDLNGPLLYLNEPDKFPLAYGLERFVSAYSDQTPLLLAASVLFTIPPLVLFAVAQRTFVEGVATTGMKS